VTFRAPAVRRRRRVGRTILVVAVVLVAGAIVFALGVGLGRTLEERPPPGGTRTYVQTLETVTVTIRP
jgi:hypothetical protein